MGKALELHYLYLDVLSSHHCPGCHNPESWNPDNGKPFTKETKEKLFSLIDKPYVDGLTLSGGDPLAPCNLAEVRQLCFEFKRKFPNKTIWLYTGYTFDQIRALDFLRCVDVVVDGPFIEEQRDITLAFRGSKNQNLIKITK